MIDVAPLRIQFPALSRKIEGQKPVFFDGPGGTQTPSRVIDAISHYLATCNSNHGGVFRTSRESDEVLARAHAAAADLLNARSPKEIVFGQNMTSLTFHLSRSLVREFRPGNEIVVTRMDHDGNVAPWLLAAADAGLSVHKVDFHPEDCTLDLEDFRQKLSAKTRLVALTCASNAVGTLNNVKALTQMAHSAGALVFLDAVHYAPHGLIDVQDWDCDFLACSAYKFFGPHVGILWGKQDLLTELTPYKVRPAPDDIPDKWMTGTQNHEGLAGVTAAIDYIASICPTGGPEGRRADLVSSFNAIRAYEQELADKLLDALAERPRFRVWGLTASKDRAMRVPTFALTMERRSPLELATHLAEKEIYVWNGNMYALELTQRLGLLDKGGYVRIGLVHYNLPEEIDRLMECLDQFPD